MSKFSIGAFVHDRAKAASRIAHLAQWMRHDVGTLTSMLTKLADESPDLHPQVAEHVDVIRKSIDAIIEITGV